MQHTRLHSHLVTPLVIDVLSLAPLVYVVFDALDEDAATGPT